MYERHIGYSRSCGEVGVVLVAGLLAVAGNVSFPKTGEHERARIKRMLAPIDHVMKLASFGWLDWWLWLVVLLPQQRANASGRV